MLKAFTCKRCDIEFTPPTECNFYGRESNGIAVFRWVCPKCHEVCEMEFYDETQDTGSVEGQGHPNVYLPTWANIYPPPDLLPRPKCEIIYADPGKVDCSENEPEESSDDWDGASQRWRADNPAKLTEGSDKPREGTGETQRLPAAKWDAAGYDYEQFGKLLKEHRNEFIGLWNSAQAALECIVNTTGYSKKKKALIIARTVEAFNKMGIPVRVRGDSDESASIF